MKDLLLIQQDVRKIEKTVGELSRNILNIYRNIERLQIEGNDRAVDFKKIKKLAKILPFENHTLASMKLGTEVRVSYIKLLLMVVRIERRNETISDRLIFAQWMMDELLKSRSLEELIYCTFAEFEDLFEEDMQQIREEIKLQFAVDLLMISNCAGEPEKVTLQYVAKILTALGLETHKIRLASSIARITLTRSTEAIEAEDLRSILNLVSEYSHYLDKELVSQILVKSRSVILNVPAKEVSGFKWQGKILSKAPRVGRCEAGEQIATFTRKSRKTTRNGREDSITITERVNIKTPGFLFAFEHRGYYYAVVSHQMDQTSSIKLWLKNHYNA